MKQSELTKPEVGDWVAFNEVSSIIIGQILYIKVFQLGSSEIYTTAGQTDEESILEIRKKNQ